MKGHWKSAPTRKKVEPTTGKEGLRLGLCCQFAAQPIKFHTTTVRVLERLPRREQLSRLAALGSANAESMLTTLRFCAAQGIGSSRITCHILPIKTHPAVGYRVEDLPGADEIVARLQRYLHCEV